MINFVKNIEILKNYEDFVILKDKINRFIINIFNEKLE
jgi:hypothetical protein